MTLIHKTFLDKVEIDFENGISCSLYKRKIIRWPDIIGIVGYKKPALLGMRYIIGCALHDPGPEGGIIQFELIKDKNEYKYRYFVESIVNHMKDNHGAIGGTRWCARPLDSQGNLLNDNDLFQSYVLCRILSGHFGTPWFDHTDEEELLAAIIFLKHRLIRDGTEVRQVFEAVQKSGFGVQQDGSINCFRSSGYQALDIARSKFIINKSKDILIIADELGDFLNEIIGNYKYNTSVLTSYKNPNKIYEELNRKQYDLLILTNNCLSPNDIKEILPVVNNFYPNLKVIVMSSFYNDEYLKLWDISGATIILPMPFNKETLLEEINRLLA